MAELLGIADRIRLVAWLCLGPVGHLEDTPDLERHGWRRRRPLAEALHYERWTEKTGEGTDNLATTDRPDPAGPG